IISSIIESVLTTFENPILYALKDDNHVILHLFSSSIEPIVSSGLHHVCYELSSALKKEFHSFSIAAGKIVPSVKRLQESYTSAVLRLQESFFHKPGSVILHDNYGSEVHSEHYQVPAELFNRFQ
ncbi:hypothetical protein AB4Z22_46045, partial [Paenibacillus sp. TAF58]